MRQPMLEMASSLSDALRFAPDTGVPRRPRDIARRLGVTAALLAIVVLILTLATPGPIELPLGGCRNTPSRLIFGETFEASMSLDRNTACSIWLRPGSASVDKLEITSLPRHGALTPRGRTGVIYRADRNFKGEDSFAFAMRGQSAAYKGTSFVRVRVVVR